MRIEEILALQQSNDRRPTQWENLTGFSHEIDHGRGPVKCSAMKNIPEKIKWRVWKQEVWGIFGNHISSLWRVCWFHRGMSVTSFALKLSYGCRSSFFSWACPNCGRLSDPRAVWVVPQASRPEGTVGRFCSSSWPQRRADHEKTLVEAWWQWNMFNEWAFNLRNVYEELGRYVYMRTNGYYNINENQEQFWDFQWSLGCCMILCFFLE